MAPTSILEFVKNIGKIDGKVAYYVFQWKYIEKILKCCTLANSLIFYNSNIHSNNIIIIVTFAEKITKN